MDLILHGGRWTCGDEIDSGGFGRVFDAVSPTGSAAVAKFVRKVPGAERELLLADFATGAGFRNVVPVIDRGEHGDDWVIVMPKASMSLERYLLDHAGRLDVAEVVAILHDIVTTLVDIDGKVVHRDLKPANVLLLNGVWCLADFGISRYAEAATAADTRKFNLSPQYGAPEQWRGQRATIKTDVYSFGVVAYQLISGRLPFMGPTQEDFREQHLTEEPPELTVGTTALRQLIDEALFKAADARPSPANLLQRLDTAAHQPVLAGLARLAEASHSQVKRTQAANVEDAKRQQLQDDRLSMFAAAVRSFQTFSTAVSDAIESHAPSAVINRVGHPDDMLFVVTLSGAKLGMSKPMQIPTWDGPFDVIACANLAVRIPERSQDGWQGRSHALWFCDAQEKGQYGWYEMAFMESAFSSQPRVVPFSSTPEEALEAFQGVIGQMQLAWPLEKLDRDDPSELVSRWTGWFADAAEANLRRPSRLPERTIDRSWRSA